MGGWHDRYESDPEELLPSIRALPRLLSPVVVQRTAVSSGFRVFPQFEKVAASSSSSHASFMPRECAKRSAACVDHRISVYSRVLCTLSGRKGFMYVFPQKDHTQHTQTNTLSPFLGRACFPCVLLLMSQYGNLVTTSPSSK